MYVTSVSTVRKGCGLTSAVLLLLIPLASAQTIEKEQAAKSSTAVTASSVLIHTTDTPDLVRETQQALGDKDYVGLIWWIPFEFWEQAGAKRGQAQEKTADNFKALKDYTVVGVFAARVSGLGVFTYIPPVE